MAFDGEVRQTLRAREGIAGRTANPAPYMEARAALRQIEAGQLGPAYLIHGPDAFWRGELLAAIERAALPPDPGLAALNRVRLEGEEASIAAACDAARTPPLLAERRLVLVVDPPGFLPPRKGEAAPPAEAEEGGGDAAERALLDYLERPAPTGCLVVALSDAADRRRRLTRAFERRGVVVACQGATDRRELAAFLAERARALGAAIEPAAAVELAERVPGGGPREALDLMQADRELRKVLAHAGDRPATVADVRAVVPAPPEGGIFDLVDAIGRRDARAALRLAADLLERGTAPIYVASMIARQLRLILSAHAIRARGGGEAEVARELGLRPYPARLVLAQCRDFPREALPRALARVLELDLGLKSSAGEPRVLVELCILDLCRLA